MLSKRASSHVTKSMGVSEADVDKLFKTELYEDVVIGHWLEDGGFIPRHFPLLDKDAEWANYTTHNPIFASGKHHGAALRVNPHAYDPDDENPIMLHLKKDESIFARLREVAGPRRQQGSGALPCMYLCGACSPGSLVQRRTQRNSSSSGPNCGQSGQQPTRSFSGTTSPD